MTFDCAFVVKEHLRLKSRYKERVQAAIEYMKMIDDFDDLVDPRTLACHFLGLESSCALSRSKRKVNFALIFFFFFNVSPFCHAEMMTKFNQEMYARMKAKKNKLLSSLGKKVVRVVENRTSITPVPSVPEVTRTASPTTFLEELTPCPKRQRTLAKEKEKVGSQASNVWDDARIALVRAHLAVTAKDLKALFGVPSYELVSCHVHKLIQVNLFSFCITYSLGWVSLFYNSSLLMAFRH